MPAPAFVLTERQATILSQMIADYDRRIQNPRLRPEVPGQFHDPPVYVAFAIADIPALNDQPGTGSPYTDVAGSGDAKLFQRDPSSNNADALIPLPIPVQKVWNLSLQAIPANTYFPIVQDKFGDWYATSLMSGGIAFSGAKLVVAGGDNTILPGITARRMIFATTIYDTGSYVYVVIGDAVGFLIPSLSAKYLVGCVLGFTWTATDLTSFIELSLGDVDNTHILIDENLQLDAGGAGNLCLVGEFDGSELQHTLPTGFSLFLSNGSSTATVTVSGDGYFWIRRLS